MGGLGIGLSATVTKKLFPYHIIMDEAFQIVQVGQDLAQVLKCSDDELIGMDIADVLEITKPKSVSSWDWNWLRRLEDQSFNVEPVLHNTQHLCLSFKTSVVLISDFPTQAMLIMAPDAGNLEALMEMNLTLSDLPVHGEYRDAVFLREHLSSQMNSTLKMEKLSKSLAREKELLESLLPQHAAEGLRAGKTVEPMLHKHTTFFFSDVVGFTTICKNLYPWEVIGMLNRLYCVMDFLALRFNLFKVETIGDAFVAASGLPQPDENHAENVANFAVAVQHCCRQVLSPLEKEPIRLRVGIHTGPCASGIVGTTNPRYCVFGDTVNTTARHESSGEPGKIHCSRVTKEELERRANDKFSLAERGLVEMKGKGEQLTYWLTGSESNKLVNGPALEKLDLEVKRLLETTNFDIEAQKERARKSLGVLSQMDGEQTLEAFIEKEVTRRSESVIEATLREASQRDSTDRLSQHEEADTRIKKSAVRDLDLCPKRSEVCESFECRCRIL
jgi:class 3 adenylate cyclase